jgi:hypothetical protein
MATAATFSRDLGRLKEVANHLGRFQGHLSPTYYDWLTPEYLTKEIGLAEEVLSKVDQENQQLQTLKSNRGEARQELYKEFHAVNHAFKAWLYLTDKVDDAGSYLATTHDVVARVDSLLTAVNRFPDSSNLASIDLNSLVESLKKTRQVYLDSEKAFEEAKAKMPELEKTIIEEADRFDDVFHAVKNALEGAFHDDRDKLKEVMPWRG